MNFTKKDAINIVLIIILAYTAFTLTQPQGQELTECRVFAPLINYTKTCAADNPQGNWTLLCVSQQEYAMRTQQQNITRWTTK